MAVINSEEALAISGRFFNAIDTLIAQGKMRGLGTFTRTNNINYGNFFQIRKNPETKIVKPEFLMYLCRDYGISADWLLMGTGEMFKPVTISEISSVDIKRLISTLNESQALNKRLAEDIEKLQSNN